MHEVVAIMARAERMETTLAAGLLAWHLAHGEAISNADAARLTCLDEESARQMLCRLSGILPIVFVPGRSHHEPGLWMTMSLLESSES